MAKLIDVPGQGVIEFPDNMSDDQIQSALSQNFQQEQVQGQVGPALPFDINAAQQQPQGGAAFGLAGRLGMVPGVPSFGERTRAGAARGLRDLNEGVTQITLEVGEKMGLDAPGTAQQYTAQKQAERQRAAQQNIALQFPEATVARVGAAAAPYLLSAPLLPASLPAGVAASAGLGALAGGTQFVPPGESRLQQAGIGALGGAALAPGVPSAALGAIGRTAAAPFRLGAQALGSEGAVAARAFEGVTPEVARAGLKSARSAEKLGLQTRPAEATQDAILASREGAIGQTKEGKELLLSFGQNRQQQEKQVIRSLLDDLSPKGTPAAENIRTAANKIISREEQALSDLASPLYKEAYAVKLPQEVTAELLQDPIVAQAAQRVSSSPVFRKEVQEFGPGSIKSFDLVKRNLDDQVSSLLAKGKRNEARLITKAKKELVAKLDDVSPEYKQARSIFAEDAPKLERLRKSKIGQIAKLPDEKLKTISKSVFDKAETDPKVLDNVRKQLMKEDPKAWGRLVRNELDRRLDLRPSGEAEASSLYNSIMRNDADFKMFLNATKGIPEARKKLIYMKRTFSGLIEPTAAKGEAFRTQSFLNSMRNTTESLQVMVRNMLGGKYDRAAVNLMTSPKWNKQFEKIIEQKAAANKVKGLAKLLDKISKAQPAVGAVAVTQE